MYSFQDIVNLVSLTNQSIITAQSHADSLNSEAAAINAVIAQTNFSFTDRKMHSDLVLLREESLSQLVDNFNATLTMTLNSLATWTTMIAQANNTLGNTQDFLNSLPIDLQEADVANFELAVKAAAAVVNTTIPATSYCNGGMESSLNSLALLYSAASQ